MLLLHSCKRFCGVRLPAWWASLLLVALAALFAANGHAGRTLPPGANAARPPVAGPVTPSSLHPFTPSPASTARVSASFARLPLQFEANHGQTDARVRFLSRGPGYTVYLADTEAVLSLRGSAKRTNAECRMQNADCRLQNRRPGGTRARARQIENRKSKIENHVLRMRLVGAERRPRVDALERLPGVVNYLMGNDPKKWRTQIPTYAKVRFRGVYPGVDLVYYGSESGRLEYDFVVAPGADPKQIRLAFQGADKTVVDPAGDLVLRAGTQEVRFRKPAVYQEIAGRRVAVAAGWALGSGFRLQGSGFRAARESNRKSKIENRKSASFALAAYDRRRPLVIDPVLVYSTYLGGSEWEKAYALVVDAAGCVYVAGATHSADFPTTPGGFLAAAAGSFVTKLNAAGSALLYSTYMEGAAGGMAVDASGCAYVAGEATLDQLPITPGAYQDEINGFSDAYLVKLSAAGDAVLYGTYLGGTEDEQATDVAVDAAGCAYVAGATGSDDLPTTPGAFDRYGPFDSAFPQGFVTKFNAAGSALAYSTFIGGTWLDTTIGGIALDAEGCLTVVGSTNVQDADDFRTTAGAFQRSPGGLQDGFVTRLSPTGGARYSTYLGGSGQEWGNAVAVDSEGCAYVVGSTHSSNFPVTAGALRRVASGQDAFLTKLNATGSALVYSTYLGGSGSDSCRAVAADSSGCAHVAGYTYSADFPTSADAWQGAFGGGSQDAFVARVNAAGSALLWSSYLGGGGFEYPMALALDASGCTYVAGYTTSTNFPTTPGAFRMAAAGDYDGFVVKLEERTYAFVTQPTNTVAGTPITPAVRVAVLRPDGNVDTAFSKAVTIAVGANPGGGTLAGTTTVTPVNGVATFSDLSIDKAGNGYTLVMPGTPVVSSPFSISKGAATRLAFTVQPVGAITGAAITPAIKVAIQDDSGNTITTSSASVTLAIGANPGGGTLSGTLTAATAAGVATFPDLGINRVGTGYTLVATAAGLSGATSGAFNVTLGPAKLAFSVQPTSGYGGATMSPAPRVAIQDASGNTVTASSASVTIAIGTNPGGGTLTGTKTVAAVGGIATFSDLSINKVGTGYTLAASSAGLTGTTSASFSISAGMATRLAFTVQPSNVTLGERISPAIKVTVVDGGGNPATSSIALVSLSIGSNPSGGALMGTTRVTSTDGVATFSDVAVDTMGSGYTLTASAEGLTSATSTAFNVTQGSANRLVFTGQPYSTQAGYLFSYPSMVRVAVQDAAGNWVTSSSARITLAFGSNPGGGALSGTKSVYASSGLASFSDICVTKAGNGYTLVATSPGLVPATSDAFNISPGSAYQLGFIVQPTDTTATTPFSPTVKVAIQDRYGNTVPGATDSVTVTLQNSMGGGTLSGTTTVAAVSGIATFSNLSVDTVRSAYTLRATAGSLDPATSDYFDINAGAPTKLAFTTQPASAVRGAPIRPWVSILDAGGNVVTSSTANVTIAIGTNPSGGTLSGTKTVAAVQGRASFTDLSIDQVGSGYTLVATSPGVTNATSTAFYIIDEPPAKLAFVTQPTDATGGNGFAPAVQVAVEDQYGNIVPSSTATIRIALGNNPTGATLGGFSQINAVAGIATFDLGVDKIGTGYTLVASSTGLTGATSEPFNISLGPAKHLDFLVEPSYVTVGSTISPPVKVVVMDHGGNTVTTSTATITLTLYSGTTGATLSGTTTAAAVAGVATFSDLRIDKSGKGFHLKAASYPLSSDYCYPFDVRSGPAAKLGFVVQPPNGTAGNALTPSVQVAVQDAAGNTDIGSRSSITLSVGNNPAGGTLSGSKTVTASSGVAAFSDLSIDKIGAGYTLTASATGLTGATSSAFGITAGPPTKLGFTVQPASNTVNAALFPAVRVALQDTFGNTCTTSNASITVAIGTNPAGGTLSGTRTVATTNGVAAFSDLKIDKVGTGYTLVATAPGYLSATSAAFDLVTPPTPTRLKFTIQPTNTVAHASMANVQVTVQDDLGHTATTSTAAITLAIGNNPGGGTLVGTLTKSAVAGVATFDAQIINKAGVGYTLVATSPGLAGDTSSPFDIVAGAPYRLCFITQPTSALYGSPIAPPVQVAIQDMGANLVTSSTLNVTVAISTNPAGGSLSGTKTVAAVNGVATFNNLSISKAGIGYKLAATSGSLVGAASSAFDITPGPPSHLWFVTQPATTAAGAAISPAVQVAIVDVGGNTVTTSTGSVTLALGAGPAGGTLSGTKTVAAVNGVATFGNLSIDKVGAGYKLEATAAGVIGATSNSFAITTGGAAKLAFTVQPASATVGAAISPAVKVAVQDAAGNTITSSTASITVAIGTNPGGGTLSGTKTVAAVSGVATFSGLSIDKVGAGYTLAAAATGLTGATSSAFNITPGTAAKLAFTVQPANTAVGAAISPAVKVVVQDALGNPVTTSNAVVILGTGTNPGSGTLSGTKSVAAVNGVATFTDLSIDRVGNGYTLVAAATGLTGATSSAFNITPGGAAKLAFTVQPANSGMGLAINPPVKVAIQDALGNVVTASTANVTLAIGANPGGGTLIGTKVVAAVSGVATFSGVAIDRAGNGYTLSASATGLTGATSSTFNVPPAPASKLGFVVQPTDAVAGAAITPAVKVAVQDMFGNTITTSTASVTLAIAANPGGGTLSGTKTVAAVAGLATFSDLSIDKAGVGYRLSASASGLTGAFSNQFTIVDTTPTLGALSNRTDAEGAVVDLVLVGADADGDALTYAAAGLPPGLSLNADTGAVTGTLAYTAAAGSPYSVAVTVTDDTPGGPGGDSAHRAFTWTVTNLDTTPTIADFANRAGAEGSVVNFAVPGADADGDTLTYAATGLPPGLSINASTGLMTGTLAYTAAAGSPYTVTVTVTDNTPGGPGGDSASRAFSWRVTTLDTTPTLAALPSRSSPEGSAVSFTASGADVDGDILTYSAENLPPGVSINTTTGAVTGTLSYTAAAGSRYTVTVTVTDDTPGGAGGDSASSTFSWTVMNVDTRPFLAAVSGQTSAEGAAVHLALTGSDADGDTLTWSATGLPPGLSIAAGAITGTLPYTAAAGSPYSVTVTLTDNTPGGPSGDGASRTFTWSVTNADTTPSLAALPERTDAEGATVSFAAAGSDADGDLLSYRAVGLPPGITIAAGTGLLSGMLPYDSAGVYHPTVTVTDSTPGGAGGDSASRTFTWSVTSGDTRPALAEIADRTNAEGDTVTLAVSGSDADGDTLTYTAEGLPPGVSINAATGAITGVLSHTAAGVHAVTVRVADSTPGGPAGDSAERSFTWTVTESPAARLVFTTQPVDVAAGQEFTVVVTARDARGQTDTGFAAPVSLGVYTGPAGGNLLGDTVTAAVAGVATFTVRAEKAGTYTLVAASGVLSVQSIAFHVLPGAAAHLVFAGQPSDVAAGAVITPAVRVAVQDAYGNTVTGAATTVALAVDAGPAGGTLFGAAAVPVVEGVAAFADLSLDKAGVGYVLRASAPGLASITSAAFNVTAAGPARLLFLAGPVDTPAGTALSPVTVVVQDALGNAVTTPAVTISVTLTGGAAGATLLGTRTGVTLDGVAVFGSLRIDRAGSGYRLVATAAGVDPVESAPFSITAGAAYALAFVGQPSDTAAGAAIAPAVRVEVRDRFGNRATGSTLLVTVALGGAALGGTLARPAVDGVATFDDLVIEKAGAGYALQATAAGVASATSARFTIVPAGAARLAFNRMPATVVAGAALSPAPQVAVLDRFGNVVRTAAHAVMVALGANPGGATLGGTKTVSASNGYATFYGLVVNRAATGYTLVASAAGLEPATSPAFVVAAGLPTRLGFKVLPVTLAAGAAFTVKVEAYDRLGNLVPFSGTVVTLALATSPAGAVLGGTKSAEIRAGVATFAGLVLNTAGTYTLSATAPGLTAARSVAIRVASAAAARLAFTVQPRGAAAGATFSPAVTVALRDRFGNAVTTASGAVTLALYANPARGSLGGTLTLPVSAGVATFRDLKIGKVGSGYTLRATCGALTPAASAAFAITPGTARKLGFTRQPRTTAAGAAITPAVIVSVLDACDNVVPTAAHSVTMCLIPPAGVSGALLSGSKTAAAVNGAAPFANLRINKVAAGYALRASATGLTSVTSQAFPITPGTAARLVFVQRPTSATAGQAFPVKAAILDAFGNTVTSSLRTVTLSLGANPSGAVLSGTRTAGAAAGIATFAAVSISRPGTGFTLKATASGLLGAETPAIRVVAP